MLRHLFGYGTLRDDLPERHSSPPRPAELVGTARLPGRLVVWGGRWAGLIHPDHLDTVSRVVGQVWELQNPHEVYDFADPKYGREDWLESHWHRLDVRERYYEDSPQASNYIRRPATVTLNGEAIEVGVYYLNYRKFSRMRHIDIELVESGDWLDWIEEAA